jgi:hypothetical protein
MADYTVRIELPGASEAEYGALDTVMLEKGFSNSVRAKDGTLFQLPSAEYIVGGWPITVEQIVDIAKHLADTVRPGARVFGTTATYWQWKGLPKA